MDEPRLKTEFRISAYLRQVQAGGAFATVVKKGDPDAGAIAIKVYMRRAEARLLIQSRDLDGRPIWRDPLDGSCDEARVDGWLEKERAIDPDLWVIEIEDSQGRDFLE